MTGAVRPDAPAAFCDLIMKGGITSGVIYPKLIGKLAEAYRLKNIGGTSAGAIAAAGAAAAEFQRHTRQTDAGFARLNRLPEELGNPTAAGRSRLLALFQPIPELEPHFEALLNTLNVKVPLLAALEVAFQVVRRFPCPGCGILALALVLPWSTLLALTGQTGAASLGALALLAGWLGITWMVRLRYRNRIERRSELAVPLALWLAAGLGWTFGLAWLCDSRTVGLPVLVPVTLALATEILLICGLALAGSGWAFARSLLNGLGGNGFGFCDGRTHGPGPEALTDWLTGYFNELAGLDPAERPLSFGDLWRGDRDTAQPLPANGQRVINLEAMTSAVSRKMPYRIPFTRDDKAYYFDPDEWGRLFPPAVLAAMTVLGPHDKARHPDDPGRPLYRLPPAECWPVVVAVRMSLSFPILLAAVPLYAADRAEQYWDSRIAQAEGRKPATRPTYKKVWFSDGGISSNIPVHFFDAFLPQHPTFIINLTEKHPKADELERIQQRQSAATPAPGYEDWRVYLPSDNRGGRERTWKTPADGGLVGFLWSVVETMQNWRDEIQFPYPGYRDRIVQISQSQHEGGLNLNMPKAAITALSKAGEHAGQKLIDRFIAGGGWENHRKIRLRSLLAQLELKLDELDHGSMAGWQSLLADMADPPHKLTDAEKRLADATLDSLVALARELQAASETLAGKSAPHPFAELRISPRV